MNIDNGTVKRKTGLIVLIVIITLVLIGTGVFAYLFFKTDMFKSNEELFWKYMSKNSEMTSVLKYQQDDNYKNKAYNETTKIDFNINQEELRELNNCKISIDTKRDIENNRTYSMINTQYNEQKLFDLEYLKDGETYALKNTEIANGYIAVKNENLKELAEKLGIETTEIPDKITMSNYSELFNISKEEKQHIVDTYYDVVKSNISKNKYTKRKNTILLIEGTKYNVNSYSITLTEKECQNLMVSALEKLRTDSITLNLISTKMKIVNKDSQFASINQLNEQISKLSQQIREKETKDEQFITITVYESKGKTISTNIEVINQSKISISYISEQNKVLMTQELAESSEKINWSKIVLMNKYSETNENFLLDMELTDNRRIRAQIEKEKTDKGYIMNANINIFDNIINLYSERVLSNFENVYSLNESTNIILNDLEKEKLDILLPRLKAQITKVLQEKKNMIIPIVVEKEPVESMTEII